MPTASKESAAFDISGSSLQFGASNLGHKNGTCGAGSMDVPHMLGDPGGNFWGGLGAQFYRYNLVGPNLVS